MIFINWREFFAIALPLALTALFVLLMWQARRKPLWTRILTAIIATPFTLAALGLSALSIFIATTASRDNSNPIRSPDGKRAARVETWSGFLNVSDTNVRIYSLHGLLSSSVYSGGEQTVEDVRWRDNHTLEVRYTYDNGHTCDSTRNIRVICLSVDTLQYDGTRRVP
jgi:hypothetical protein